MTTSDLQTIRMSARDRRKLERLGVTRLDDLRGRDPHEPSECLCALDGQRHDPCLLDTFVAIVGYADSAPPRPWLEYSRERRAAKGARIWPEM